MKVNRLLDIFCPYHKFLIYNLVSRNLKLKYRKSYLGILWTMVGPAFSALVYFIVFQFIVKIQIPNYLLFLVIGVLPWTFFVTCIGNGLESLVLNHSLLNKIPLPIHALPFSESLTAYINFLLSIPVIAAIAIITDAPMTLNLLLVPYFFLLLFFQGYAVAIILSIYFVYFRDLRHALVILVQVWFYVTPIIYEISMVPKQLAALIYLNPLFMIFSSLHEIIVFGRTPSALHFGLSTIWTLVFFFLSYWILRRKQFDVVESL